MDGIDTLIMASGMKVVKMGAGPCSCFRTVTVTFSVIFVTVVKSLAGNARMVVWCPHLERHEKRGDGKRRQQHGSLDRRGDRGRRGGHVECGS